VNSIEPKLVIEPILSALAVGLIIGAWVAYRFCESRVAKLEKEVEKLTMELWERGTARRTPEAAQEALE
jgi:uncharacterized membrane-anchored protein YhcB (DUF1043 family)